MVTYVTLNNFDEFDKYTQNIKPEDPPVFFYFSGKKFDGISWCPDCVEAEPIVKACLDEQKKALVFVYVDVGDMVEWRKKDCPFRTDTRTKLLVIPTLIKWKGVQRLEGSQCSKRELVQMLFEDEDA